MIAMHQANDGFAVYLALILLLQHVTEDLEDSQSGGCVGGLPQETS